MSLVSELHELADTLSKATPGPWEFASAQAEPYPPTKEALLRYISESWDDSHGEGWGITRSASQKSVICLYGNGLTTNENAEAICVARNSEDLLRQAADELERLQKVVEQVKRLLANRGDGFIVRFDEQNGGLHLLFETIDEEGNPIDLDIASVDNAHELAAELEARNG